MSCGTIYTHAMLEALEKAIADGVESVKYSDKEVKYRSLAEMKEIARDMRNVLCGTEQEGGATRRFFKVFATSSKGLC